MRASCGQKYGAEDGARVCTLTRRCEGVGVGEHKPVLGDYMPLAGWMEVPERKCGGVPYRKHAP